MISTIKDMLVRLAKNALLLTLSGLAFLLMGTRAEAQADPSKVLGPDTCGNCHKLEFNAWKTMKHAKTFDDLHRRQSAKDIAGKLQIANIKANTTCTQCHYTDAGKGPGKPIAGVSCESCHGSGKDWVKLHNIKGKMTEAEAQGFISSQNIYKLASNCFECHTIPNEKLVNTSGHQAGSPLELVSWSQGEVRHHFIDGKSNADPTPERKRMLYLIGRIVDLQFSLKGVAESTEKAAYAVGMAKRVVAAKAEMKKIVDVLPKDEVKAVLAAADGVVLKLKNREPIMAAVKTISELGQKISDTYKGSDLAALDPLIPTTTMGKPYKP